jgi:membrane fusion protein (multidrug efflux system)
MGRTIGILAVLLLLACGGYWFWTHSKAAPEASGKGPKGPQVVVTAPVAAKELTLAISAVGSLLAGESASIHAEIAGQVQRILFEEGQPVKKGDILVEMDTSLIETDLRKARAALDVATANFSRDDKLKKSGFVANQQWDTSRAELQSAEAAVANAEILLQKATIKAPFDGIAGLRSFSPGDYAAAGQELSSIVSIAPLKLEFTAPEKDYAAVKAGQKISFSVDSYPGDTFAGEIYAVDPRINPENRNFTARATIPNDDGRLRPGMYARISIDTATRAGVLMIPEEAVIPSGNDSYVFVAQNGKASKRKVVLGARQAGEVEAVSGLKEGEKVITAGVMKLQDGGAIDEQAASPAPAPAAGK